MADELDKFRADWLREIDGELNDTDSDACSKDIRDIRSDRSQTFSQSLQDIVGTVLPYRRYQDIVSQTASDTDSGQHQTPTADHLSKRKAVDDESISHKKQPKHDFVSAFIADLVSIPKSYVCTLSFVQSSDLLQQRIKLSFITTIAS